MDWYHADYGLADAHTWVQRCVSQMVAGTDFHFAICDPRAQLIGVVSLEDVTFPGPRATLGYWVATPATGRGVATAAVRDVLAWAATHTKLRVVWARIAPTNTASCKVVEANGFRLASADPYPPVEGQVIYERRL